MVSMLHVAISEPQVGAGRSEDAVPLLDFKVQIASHVTDVIPAANLPIRQAIRYLLWRDTDPFSFFSTIMSVAVSTYWWIDFKSGTQTGHDCHHPQTVHRYRAGLDLMFLFEIDRVGCSVINRGNTRREIIIIIIRQTAGNRANF